MICSDELYFIIFSTSGRVHVWCTLREWYRPQRLTPTGRGPSGSIILWGEFSCHGLGQLVPLQGRVTANQYKVISSDHLYPMIKYFYPDGSGLLQDDNASGSTEALMSMKMMLSICCGLRSHQNSTQLNTCGTFWTDMLGSILCHHHQNTN